MKLYIASKIIHAGRWRGLRQEYRSITWVSSWIDEVDQEPEENVSTQRFAACWEQNVKDVLSSDVLALYHLPNEILSGALIEVGIALGANIPVSIISADFSQLSSWKNHPGIKTEVNLYSFLNRIA